MGNRYDILLWDVDQTLLDFNSSQEHALKAAFRQFGREIGQDAVTIYAAINDSWWKRLELGEVEKSQLLTGRFIDLFDHLAIRDIDLDAFAKSYQKELGAVYFYQDDSYKLCRYLKGHIRQYAVTNGVAATQRSKLRLSGLDAFMEDIFISEEMGAPKPSLEYFLKCFERIADFSRERTLIVGDSLSSDMKGGNQAGIACCWYNPGMEQRPKDLRIDHEIRNLWEVKEILGCQDQPIKN